MEVMLWDILYYVTLSLKPFTDFPGPSGWGWYPLAHHLVLYTLAQSLPDLALVHLFSLLSQRPLHSSTGCLCEGHRVIIPGSHPHIPPKLRAFADGSSSSSLQTFPLPQPSLDSGTSQLLVPLPWNNFPLFLIIQLVPRGHSGGIEVKTVGLGARLYTVFYSHIYLPSEQ